MYCLDTHGDFECTTVKGHAGYHSGYFEGRSALWGTFDNPTTIQ